MRYSAKQYAKTLYQLTEGAGRDEAKKIVEKFALTLKQNNDLKLFNDIIGEFFRLEDEAKKIVRIEVKSATKLDSVSRKAIIKIFEKATGKKAELKEKIDPDLIGGVKIKMDDILIDKSVKNKLALLKKALN